MTGRFCDAPPAVALPALPLAAQLAIWPFIVVFALGFAIGVFGHLISSNRTIATGIGLIFLATVVGPVLVYGNPY